MTKLFLSYAREDADIAERLARSLERSGDHDVWWDRDLVGGASFGPEIEQQLRDCDVVIVLWSTASVLSSWVRDEAAIGRDAGKLLPLSIGNVEPPIGFRQYHVIDIGAGRPSTATIRKIELAIGHFRRPGAATQDGATRTSQLRPSAPRRTIAIAAGAAFFLLAAAASVYLWESRQSSALTVAILPVGGAQAGAADYSRSISTDMASFLSASGNSASVLDPGDAGVRRASYRFNVSFSGHGSSADTSLSMTQEGQPGIIWSQSWSVPDVSSVDLKKQMSFAASRALLCAMEARQGDVQLSASLLKLYIVACSSFAGLDSSETGSESEFLQIVQQAPNFAPAWQDLALARAMDVFGQEMEEGARKPALRKAAVEALDRARQLAPRSAKVLLAEATLAASYGSEGPEDPLTLLNRAIALEPNNATGYMFRSTAVLSSGQLSNAVADAQKATELDPLSPTLAALEIYVLMSAGRISDARDHLAAAYKLWPHNGPIKEDDFTLSFYYGDPRRAAQLLNESDPAVGPLRATIAARENPTPDNIQEALDAWQQGTTTNPTLSTPYLLVLAMFGRTDEAFDLLNQAKARTFVDSAALFRPELKNLRSDKRFMAVAAQYGLIHHWKSSGNWPDFCRDAGLSYDCKAEAAKYPV
jgi:tetratricopeptide (TPR) repeat protein